MKFEAGLDYEHRHEYYQKHWPSLLIGVPVNIALGFLGLIFAGWVGIVVTVVPGLALSWFLPSFKTRTVENTRGRSQ